jgi:purine nucleosidase
MSSLVRALVVVAAALVAPATAGNAATRVIIDADTANEIDDLYAIVRALVAPEWTVEGLGSTHWRSADSDGGLEQSQRLNERILDLMGLRNRIPHPRGAGRPMPDARTPVDSPAARHIIARAHASPAGDRLLVVALGTATNLASALLLDPTIEEKVVFAFIDGDYRDGTWAPGIYNWPIDVHAVQVILESKVEYRHMPAPSVSGQMTMRKQDARANLAGHGGVWDFLFERWDAHPSSKDRERWTLWDIALVQALLRPAQASASVVPAPRVVSVDEVRQQPDNPRTVTVFHAIDAAAMHQDFWAALEAYRQREGGGAR